MTPQVEHAQQVPIQSPWQLASINRLVSTNERSGTLKQGSTIMGDVVCGWPGDGMRLNLPQCLRLITPQTDIKRKATKMQRNVEILLE